MEHQSFDSDFYDSDIEFENIGDGDLSENDDNISIQSFDSNSELDSDDLDSDDDLEDTFTSKSGMVWNKTPTDNFVNFQNILNCGVNIPNCDEMSMKDVFQYFLSKKMLEEILLETNKLIEILENSNKNFISLTELEAFIGILISSGRNRGRKTQLSELWTSDELFQQPFYSAAMARNRFIYIYSKIRFDDRFTRDERKQKTGDKLEAIRSVFDQFVENCQNAYVPKSDITIDERLATYRGRCPFRVYMKSKPGRYGIKIWIAADVETSYISNLQVYMGKQNNKRETNQGQRVVLDLVKPYINSGLSVTTDNFFTSVPLALELLNNKIYLTGTLRANKREIPVEFQASSRRSEFSSMFGYNNNLTLVSYIPRKGKAVNLLTTKFHNNEICEEENNKPKIILYYNKTKGAVDSGDMMTSEYSIVRVTRRWPFRLFMELIDIAALNAYVVWKAVHPDWRNNDSGRRKVFLRELAKSLATKNVQNRKYHMLHKPIKRCIDIFKKAVEDPHEPGESSGFSIHSIESRKTCEFCHYKKKRRTSSSCCYCNRLMCGEHRLFICYNCKDDN